VTTAPRTVVAELLDELPPDDPQARRSRRDLRRVHRAMGSATLLGRALRQLHGPPPATTPVSTSGRPSLPARRILRAAISVAEGITILTLFSTGLLESNSRMSCVPVPMSMARMRMHPV